MKLRLALLLALFAMLGLADTAAQSEQQGQFAILHRFAIDGPFPNGELAVGADGQFYGVTYGSGEDHSIGTIFRVAMNGELRTIARLDGTPKESPWGYLGHCYAGLTPSADGWLYGTTFASDPGGGAFFRVSPQGEVHEFFRFTRKSDPHRGDGPWAELLEQPDGWFYGTTRNGGKFGHHGGGTLFRVARDGRHEVLFDFQQDGPSEFGSQPKGKLTRGTDGALYGVCGERNIFRLDAARSVTRFARLPDEFGDTSDRLLLASDGSFYGTSEGLQGRGDHGCVFRISPAGETSRLIRFTGRGGAAPGADPRCGLTQGRDGALYGMTHAGGALDMGTIFRVTLDGGFTTLVHFTGAQGPCPGGRPNHALIVGPDGALYGNTGQGGASERGTVFRVTETGEFKTLASFGFGDAAGNGTKPMGGVIRASDGNYYGTTSRGGIHDCGTVFRLSPDGRLTTLAQFNKRTEPHDSAAYPSSPLIEIPYSHEFIGSTMGGGLHNHGTLFRFTRGEGVTNNGEIRIVAHFDGRNGRGPSGALYRGLDGSVWGTLQGSNEPGDFGAVFLWNPSTSPNFQFPVRFTGTGEFPGANPIGGLTEGADGALYGTTAGGGTDNMGTVFRFMKDGTFKSLHSFTRQEMHVLQAGPVSSLTRGPNGELFGFTRGGERVGPGGVFRITREGKVRPVCTFQIPDFRGAPSGGSLAVGQDGTIYGICAKGLFKVSPDGNLSIVHHIRNRFREDVHGALLSETDASIVGTMSSFDPREGGAIIRWKP